MIRTFARTLAPALALGTMLGGCNVSFGNNVSGVPLDELDRGGDAPVQITLAGPDEVVITEGETFSVTLDGDADAGEALRFDRDGNELTIARDSDIWDGNGKAIVRITMPAPQELAIAGSGTIKSATVSPKAGLEIAGAGDIRVDKVNGESLSVEIAGSGDVVAAGSAKELRVEIVGSGNVALEKLSADDVRVEIAGSGDVALASNGTVDVEIAGSGDVTVFGNAKCSLESAGSGSLTCKPATKRAKSTATK